LDEEAETSASLRAQLQRAQADYQTLKSKYDKEVTARIEEFEETRYVLRSGSLSLSLSNAYHRLKGLRLKERSDDGKPASELRGITCHMGSHSVTCYK